MPDNGPQLWDAVLSFVGVPGAVVAGGCLRDFDLGLVPKDIDVFVPMINREAWLDFKAALLHRIGSPFDFRDISCENKEYSNDAKKADTTLFGVLELTLFEHKVNIVARADFADGDVLAMLEGFDFGILRQAWMPPNPGSYAMARRIKTAASQRDHENSQATLMHSRTVPQSLSRFKRFNDRNPNVLRLVIPSDRINDVFACFNPSI